MKILSQKKKTWYLIKRKILKKKGNRRIKIN